MKYLIYKENQTDFDGTISSCTTLPILVACKNKQVFVMSREKVNNVIDSVLDGAEGTSTTETDYVKQMDDVLAAETVSE